MTVSSLEIVPGNIDLARGDSTRLTVSPLDGDGHLVSGVAITFASLDTSIVTVSATGLVIARNVGSTSVRVSGGGVTQSVPALVSPASSQSITLTPSDTTIPLNGMYTLHATVYDGTGTPILNAPVAFQSSDSTIATVTGAGIVTGKKGGVTTIIATSGAVENGATVSVLDSGIVSRTPLNGLPFGAAATKSGTAYVLRHAVNVATRFNLPSPTSVVTFALNNNPTFVTFDSSGATAYVTAQSAGVVDVITVASNSLTNTITVTGSPVIVKVAPDDKSIWVSTNVDSLYQINRSNDSILARYGLPLVPNGLAFSPTNDSLLYVSTLDAGQVVEINYKRATKGRTFLTGGKAQAVAASPDGAELYVANEALNEVEIFKLSDGSPQPAISTVGGAFDLMLSADGATIWVTESQAGIVQAFDRVSRQLQRTVSTGGAPRRIAVTPATTNVLVANEYGWVDFIK